MSRPRSILLGLACLGATLMLTACVSYRATPVDPRSVGPLRPDIEDPDAGLVGIEPAFSLKRYQVIVVERFVVSPSEIKDAEDTKLAKERSAYLQAQLVAKMQADTLLPRVVDAAAGSEAPTGEGVLVLRGEISRLTEGSQALRYLVGFGAGSAKAQVETRLVDARSQQVQLITVDRRTRGGGMFGGDSEEILTDFMDRIADSFVKFLHRLAVGGQPGRR